MHSSSPSGSVIGFIVIGAMGAVVILVAGRQGWRRGTSTATRSGLIAGLACMAVSIGVLIVLDYHRFHGVFGFVAVLILIFVFVVLLAVGLFAGLGRSSAAFWAAMRRNASH